MSKNKLFEYSGSSVIHVAVFVDEEEDRIGQMLFDEPFPTPSTGETIGLREFFYGTNQDETEDVQLGEYKVVDQELSYHYMLPKEAQKSDEEGHQYNNSTLLAMRKIKVSQEL